MNSLETVYLELCVAAVDEERGHIHSKDYRPDADIDWRDVWSEDWDDDWNEDVDPRLIM